MEEMKLPKGIRKKGNGYEARAMINGTKVTVRGTDLDQVMADFIAAKEQAMGGDIRRNYTVDEWFEEWFDTVQAKKVKDTSIRPMKNSYKRNFGFYIGKIKLKNLRPMDLQGAINALQKKGKINTGTRDALGRLSKCLAYAVANGLIDRNPCLLVEVPWEYKAAREEIALTKDEQNRFLQAAEESWYKEMFFFMFLTGVRVGEVGGLRWRDIDFENERITINHSLFIAYEGGEKTMKLTSPKTVNSVREIPFIGEMREILESQMKKQKKARKEYGNKRWRSSGEMDDLVFTTTLGSPCVRYVVQKEIDKIRKRMDMEDAVRAIKENRKPVKFRYFHPHTIRHTFATRCFENGIEPKVAQKLLGHSSITVTMNIYTHVMEDKMGDEISKFGYALTDTEAKDYKELLGDVKQISVHSNL